MGVGDKAWGSSLDYDFVKTPVVQIAGAVPTHARRRPARTAQQHPQSLSCADDRAMPHARTLTASSTRADWAGMVILLVTSLLIGSKLVAHLQAREGGQLY